MKLTALTGLILIPIISQQALAFGFGQRCSASFSGKADTQTKATAPMQQTFIKPSLRVDRHRYDIEDFLAENLGKAFLKNETKVAVEIVSSNNELSAIFDKLEELGIAPSVSTEAQADNLVTVQANLRDLTNLIVAFTPHDYFLTTYTNPETRAFVIEVPDTP